MKTYKNPFALENQWSEHECGDPFIMRFNGLYYLYCSSAGNHIKCWSSENLVDFTYEGSVCDDPVITGAYAPEVCYYKGKFYMITSPIGSGHYLLEADGPTGPFHLISDNYGLLIDGSFYIDDDGKQYMLRAGHEGIIIHSMPSTNEIDVNGKVIPETYLNYWTEGPMIIKRKGYYYLTYTGNHLLSKGYRIAYSVSQTKPDKGYVNLDNQTLLLETGTEFHALGHSSSFLAPDLDSYLIAYHNIDLSHNPRKRSTNIDRLYFNGARMYCNPIWWEQEAHQMPEFYTRGTKELTPFLTQDNVKGWLTKNSTEGGFTAEWNVNSKGEKVSVLYGVSDSKYGMITLNPDYSYEILEEDTIIFSGKLNEGISFCNYITVRLTRNLDSTIEVYMNNMYLCTYKTNMCDGYIGVAETKEQEIGFIGCSSIFDGRGDKIAKKAIPGRFDAIHCIEEVEGIPFTEKGLLIHSAKYEEGKSYTYSLNVKETGDYKIAARILSDRTNLRIKAIVGETETIFQKDLKGIKDEAGYEWIELGILSIKEESGQIALLSLQEDLVIDHFELVKNHIMEECTLIDKGNIITDQLQIIGHKGSKSMIHKYSGFTCAENLGMAFMGEDGLGDYNILTRIHKNTKPSGDVSIYIRARKESWYPHQVKESLFGYRIKLSCDGIYLNRNFYGEELLAFYSIKECNRYEAELKIHAKESTISIFLDDKLVITYSDPKPYLFGKIGIEASGEGFGFEHFSLYYDSH